MPATGGWAVVIIAAGTAIDPPVIFHGPTAQHVHAVAGGAARVPEHRVEAAGATEDIAGVRQRAALLQQHAVATGAAGTDTLRAIIDGDDAHGIFAAVTAIDAAVIDDEYRAGRIYAGSPGRPGAIDGREAAAAGDLIVILQRAAGRHADANTLRAIELAARRPAGHQADIDQESARAAGPAIGLAGVAVHSRTARAAFDGAANVNRPRAAEDQPGSAGPAGAQVPITTFAALDQAGIVRYCPPPS
jgi:hypothetical protein